jgi:pyridoxine 5-phosphate synthase
MTKLSININRIATIRNAQGGNIPNLIKTSLDMERFGAEGITVHFRQNNTCPICQEDVHDLKNVLTTKLNILGYPTFDFIRLAHAVQPDRVTLITSVGEALYSGVKWEDTQSESLIKDAVAMLHSFNIETSILVEPIFQHIEDAVQVGADRIELSTENYAKEYLADLEKAVAPYITAAKAAHQYGLGVSAGRELSLENLKYFVQHVPFLDEVIIGHSIISDALYFGLENTIQMYLSQLK